MKIVDRMPISEQDSMVLTPDGEEAVKPYQMMVLVSITDQDVVELPQDAPRLPAVLDTGNNHNFAIRQRQLQRWVPLTLSPVGAVEVGGIRVPRFAANLWLHSNRQGTVEPSGEPAFLLRLAEGVIVYPHDVPNPARLPILGLRGIIRNGLKLTIDGAIRELTLESASG